SPSESALAGTALLSRLKSALAKTAPSNSFRIRTYRKSQGSAPRGRPFPSSCDINASQTLEACMRLLVRVSLLVLLVAAANTAQAETPDPYSVVHGWPVLPDGMALGQVSGVSVDSHNHVFVFHRAEGSWAADKTKPIASNTILCFDGVTGALLAQWGDHKFLEPHGLRVDRNDN